MSGESLMSRHLGSVSGVRRSRAYRSIARVAIAGQLLTLLPPMAHDAAPAQITRFQPRSRSDTAAAACVRRRSATIHRTRDARRLRSGAGAASDARPRQAGPGTCDTEPRTEARRGESHGAACHAAATEPTLSAEPVDREFFDARIFASRSCRPARPRRRTIAHSVKSFVSMVESQQGERLARPRASAAIPGVALARLAPRQHRHGLQSARVLHACVRELEHRVAVDEGRHRSSRPSVADYAIAQWLELMTHFGDVTALEGKLKELEGRKLTGSAARASTSHARGCGS